MSLHSTVKLKLGLEPEQVLALELELGQELAQEPELALAPE